MPARASFSGSSSSAALTFLTAARLAALTSGPPLSRQMCASNATSMALFASTSTPSSMHVSQARRPHLQ
eukprot:CAMPEP_0119161052 /NCGR_PEP_ID=MMETSP1315-20130426/959_1 /TAXON_ID=676789 /ORGANISM="Prasinoderma singularis, Strain RCC927" /LENGTH=68 /DNA_ID=CAMNT_0007153745 /DNA_START=40 /DNA_END=243 /DNA_ORIENTATION=+